MTAPTQITIDGTTYDLTFQDEFTGAAPSAWTGHGSDGRWATSFSPHLDDTRWLPANGEGMYYADPDMTGLPQTIDQQNGVLSITAHELTPAEQALAGGQAYASGLLTTEMTFAASSGYIEISAQVPDQQGFLSAFWMLPADGDWSAEIDIAEVLGSAPTDHYTNLWDNGSGDLEVDVVADLSQGFHTYGLHWTDSTITWMIDGAVIRTEANTVTEDMFLALSLAVDTDWTGAPDATTDFGDALLIDYVRVYEDQGGADANAPVAGDNSYAVGDTTGATQSADVLFGTRWDDKINGRKGDDTLYGRDGNDKLHGARGDDRVFGHEGNDRLRGGGGDDELVGGTGKDRLIGGRGDDDMWGGSYGADGARDKFVFHKVNGSDRIHDFEVATDDIVLRKLNTDWASVQAAMDDQGWATVIDLGALGAKAGDQVALVGVAASDLGAGDFIL
ncbi:MAG: family 16 glycosylhydrolase [Shimia sp.]